MPPYIPSKYALKHLEDIIYATVVCVAKGEQGGSVGTPLDNRFFFFFFVLQT